MVQHKHEGRCPEAEGEVVGTPFLGEVGWAGRRSSRGRAEREGHSRPWEWHEPHLSDE